METLSGLAPKMGAKDLFIVTGNQWDCCGSKPCDFSLFSKHTRKPSRDSLKHIPQSHIGLCILNPHYANCSYIGHPLNASSTLALNSSPGPTMSDSCQRGFFSKRLKNQRLRSKIRSIGWWLHVSQFRLKFRADCLYDRQCSSINLSWTLPPRQLTIDNKKFEQHEFTASQCYQRPRRSDESCQTFHKS